MDHNRVWSRGDENCSGEGGRCLVGVCCVEGGVCGKEQYCGSQSLS